MLRVALGGFAALLLVASPATSAPPASQPIPVDVTGDLTFTDSYRFDANDLKPGMATGGQLRVGGGQFTIYRAEEYTVSVRVPTQVTYYVRRQGVLVPKTRTVHVTRYETRVRLVPVTVDLPKAKGYWVDSTGSGIADWAFFKSVGRGFVVGNGTVDGADIEGTVWYYNIRDIPSGFYTVTTQVP